MSNDMNQQRREQRGERIFDAILNDIRHAEAGTEFITVCKGAVNAGYFCHSWNIDEGVALTRIFEVIKAAADKSQYRALRGVAEKSFIYGVENPKTQSLDS